LLERFENITDAVPMTADRCGAGSGSLPEAPFDAGVMDADGHANQ
jgi:hypothetical protein